MANSDEDRAAHIDAVIAKLNECLAELDHLGCLAATVEIDLAIVRLGGQPIAPQYALELADIAEHGGLC